MGDTMKIAIEIDGRLLRQAKHVAARGRITLCVLVEQGLRRELAARRRGGKFRLRQITFRGNGLQPGLDYSRERLAAFAYESRGG